MEIRSGSYNDSRESRLGGGRSLVGATMCRPPVLEEETTEKELTEQSRRSRCERNGRLNGAGLRVSKIGGERAGGEKRLWTVGHHDSQVQVQVQEQPQEQVHYY